MQKQTMLGDQIRARPTEKARKINEIISRFVLRTVSVSFLFCAALGEVAGFIPVMQ